jgi:hypothetical protein
MRTCVVAFAACLVAGCSEPEDTPVIEGVDAGGTRGPGDASNDSHSPDGGRLPDGGMVDEADLVEVSGQIVFDPVELTWRGLPANYVATTACNEVDTDPGAITDGGASPPPCLQGSTIWIEDAIRAITGACPLAQQTVSYDGRFDFSGTNRVNVTDTTLALMATVRDALYQASPDCEGLETDATAGASPIAFSGLVLAQPPFYDGVNVGGQPPNTLNLPVYVVSTAFLELLASAADQDFVTMVDQGLVLAHVTESDGVTGVAGAQLESVYGSGSNQTFSPVLDGIYYISADLKSAVSAVADNDATTSSSGLILQLSRGNPTEYTAGLPSAPGVRFEQRLDGSPLGKAIEVFFRACSGGGVQGCP